MRYAIVKKQTEQVVNIVIWDGVSAYEPESDCDLIQIQPENSAGMGWTYDPQTGTFLAPSNQGEDDEQQP